MTDQRLEEIWRKNFRAFKHNMRLESIIIKAMKQACKEEAENIKCNCKKANKTGETSVMCCNICGKPTEDFWTNK
jgi:hypothetical protein